MGRWVSPIDRAKGGGGAGVSPIDRAKGGAAGVSPIDRAKGGGGCWGQPSCDLIVSRCLWDVKVVQNVLNYRFIPLPA